MYQLVQAHLVQFFLFEGETLDFDRTTAIIAPNGAGKSALLDALQIVMLGADNRHLRFNAQAGGQHKARTIRDYCLGTYRPGEAGRVRDTATTYITLVFRHETRDEWLSAGVALGASTDEPDHRLYGLYLAPGVALTLEDHLEKKGRDEIPLGWATFQTQLARLCKKAGTAATIEKRSERFVKDLLYRMRPQGSGGSDPVGYRKALRNALNLKNEDDIDLFVRTLVAEERPTDVARFRSLLETFRQIKDKIDQVVRRIAQAEEAAQKYEEVSRRAVRSASYTALATEYGRDAHQDQLDTVDEQLQEARKRHEAGERRQREGEQALSRLRATLQNVELELHGMAGYAGQASFEQMGAMHRQALTGIRQRMLKDASAVSDAFKTLSKQQDGALDVDVLRAAHTAWQDWYHSLAALGGDAELPQAPSVIHARLSEAGTQALPVIRAAQKHAAGVATQLEEVRASLKAARTNQSRIAAGQSELRADVARLLAYLGDAGIEARPVSDLVRVEDPAWQPAIEAYLRSHVDALLIAPKDEKNALALYRRLKGPNAVYGVKLALSSHARREASRPPKRGSVAALLSGDDDAVAYLRRQLGDLQCVDGEDEVIATHSGLTRDGLVAKGGGVERRRLPSSGELRIGGGDSRARLKALREEIETLTARERTLSGQQETFAAPLRTLARLESGGDLLPALHDALLEHAETQSRLAAQIEQMAVTADPDLLRSREHRDRLVAEIDGIDKTLRALIGEVAIANSDSEKLEKALAALQAQTDDWTRRAAAAFAEPDVDPNLVEKFREELDEKYPDPLSRRDRCEERAQDARSQLQKLLLDAWPLLQQYGKDHGLGFDLATDDWRGARSLLQNDLVQLRESELASYQSQADDAYRTAVDTFRSSVAHTLHDNFTRLSNQINALNRTLRRSPAFSNNERYEFRKEVAPEYAELYRFIARAADAGETDTLFGSAGEVPAAFREIVEDQASGKNLAASPLDDYRRFFNFEVVVKQDDQVIGSLSDRMRSGSGGEHRAPLYVIAGAALAAAYGKADGQQDGLGLILLDEFGDKIDAQNARATTDYLRSLGLQLVVAAPDTAQGTLTGVLDSYIELFRDGPFLQLTRVEVDEEGRAIMESDQFNLHPELLQAEIAKVEAEQAGA